MDNPYPTPAAMAPLEPPGTLKGHGIGAFWRYRDLVRNLVAKDIKVRYMDAMLGFIWALVNPILITLMYLFIFTFILPTGIHNFSLYLVTGMLHWMLFANVVMQGCELLVGNAALVKKISFPTILIPFSNLLVNVTLWLFALAAYLILFLPMGGRFSLVLLAYPVYLLLLILFTFGISLVLSILYVHFRDIKHIVEIVLQVAFWSAPIVYTPNLIPAKLSFLYAFNPLVEFTLIFDRFWYNGQLPTLHLTLAFCAWTFGTLALGLWLFTRWARRLVEYL